MRPVRNRDNRHRPPCSRRERPTVDRRADPLCDTARLCHVCHRGPAVHSHRHLENRPKVWAQKHARVHLHLLVRRLAPRHRVQGRRHRRQAVIRRAQPVRVPLHIPVPLVHGRGTGLPAQLPQQGMHPCPLSIPT